MNKKIISNLIAAGVISSAVLLAGCDLDFGGSGSSNNGGTTVDTVVDFGTISQDKDTTVTVDTTTNEVTLTDTTATTAGNSEGETVSLTLPATTVLLDESGQAIVDVTSVVTSVALAQDISKIDTAGVSVENVVELQAAADPANEYSSVGVANLSVIAQTSAGSVDITELSEAADVNIEVQDASLEGITASQLDVYAYLPANTDFKAIRAGWIWKLVPRSAVTVTIGQDGKVTITFKTKLPALFNVVRKNPKATGSTGGSASGN